MSANIHWLPIGPNGQTLPVDTPQEFIEVLELPAIFGTSDIGFLRGVSAAKPDWKEAIDQLTRAIEKHGHVRVYQVY